MSNNQDAKRAVVAEIKDKFQRAKCVVLVDYRGLTVAEDTALRVEFRKNGCEYAVLKTLGYTGLDIVLLIMGEALVITFCGALLGIALTFPVARGFSSALGQFFPVFNVKPSTIVLDLGVALVVGIAAALIPARRAVSIRIADGLRRIG